MKVIKIDNVVDLATIRAKKSSELVDPQYQAKVINMSIFSLLEEMTVYNDERRAKGNTLASINKGIILFKEISVKAQTPELRQLASSYYRHLTHELKEMKGK